MDTRGWNAAYLMSNRCIHCNKFAAAFDGFKDVSIIFTAEHDPTSIHITVHYPFDQVLHIVCELVNLMENDNWKNQMKPS